MTAMDVSEATFQAEVLDRSHQVPVVVDFWAEWCAPCRALGPVLERLADEADGSWVLAKLDVDANPNLAAAARVQSIPAVKAFKDGKIVDEFVGALPESQVRQWIEGLGPSESDRLLEEASGLESAGRPDEALALYRRVLDLEPGRAEARTATARLELAARSGQVDEAALRDRLAADPTDVGAATALADQLAAAGELAEAFDLLVGTVRLTTGDEREQARIHLLGLLDTVPPDDPRAVAARRALSLVLY